MPEISNLQVVVGYDDSAVTAGVGKTSSTVSGLASSMQSVFAGIGAGIGMKAFDTISSSIKTAADTAIGFNSNLEQSTIAFTSMLGSAEKAQAFLADMKAFAASTPFEFPDLLQSSKQMLAFGFAAKDVKPLLTAVGSAAAAMGTGKSGVESITLALGQMRAATVVQAGELNQLTEQGVPAFQILADAMHISTGEVKKLAGEGKIASSVFIDAFQVWAKTNYGDMMAKQALTFEGAMSNIHDSLTFAVADAFKPFFEVMSAGAVQLGNFVQSESFTAWAKSVADTTRDAFRQIGDAVRTVQQVLAGDWSPSDQIESFALAVGNAAVAVRDFGQWVVGLPEPLKAAGVAFAAVMLGAGPLGVVLQTVGLALKLLAAPIAAVLSPLGILAIAVGALAAAWTLNLGGIQEKAQAFLAIVGPAFTALGPIVQRALGGDVAGAFELFKSLVSGVAAQLRPLLAQWGQEFIDWIAPMIPPMLAAAADIGRQLLAWITAQIPPLLAQLLLWGQQFVAWVAPFIPPMLAALADLSLQFLTWIAAQIPPLVAQLLLWGQAFVDWVAPFIPPLLAALADLGAQALAWVAAQIPLLAAQLLLWGQQFVAWVAPMIPPMLAALATVGTAMIAWLTAEIPLIAAQLTVWGQQFSIWVGPASLAMVEQLGVMAGSIFRWFAETQTKILAGVTAWATEFGKIGELGAPELAKGLALLFVQIETAFMALPGKMLLWGVAAIQAFIKGFLSVAIPTPTLPSFGGGGGNTGAASASPLSYHATTSGGFATNEERLAYGGQLATKYGHDPATVQRAMTLEGAGPAGPVGDGGRSFGGLQAYTGGGQGNQFQAETGLDPSNPNNEKALLDWQISHLSQTGWAPFHGPVQKGGFSPFQGINVAPPQAPPMNPADMQRIPLKGGTGAGTGAPGASPADWPGFMQQVNEQLPDYLTSLDTIQQSGVGTFGAVAQGAVASGAALVSASTDSLGNVTRIYSENGVAIGATITDTAGQIVNAWGTMGTGITEQTALLATGVTEQTNLMATGALTSVTALGTGTLTTVQTTAGTTIATVTDMTGQVTSQYATLANGAQLSMDGLAAGVLTSTTDLGTGVLTIVADMSGNTIATITDMSGQVTSQYAGMAGAATEMASTTSAQFGAVGKAADATQAPIKHFDDTVKGLKPPDLSGFVSEFNKVTSAANKAADAIATVNGKGGSKGGKSDGGSNIFAKAAGGSVDFGQTYLVGEQGPELFSPRTSGTIIPHGALMGGGGQTTVINVEINGSLVHERDLDDVIAGAVSRSLRSGSSGLRR